ncbi:Gamma-glutamyltranspeptidase precursor [Pseudobythopirellula maris]|uniref:Gamma-glutamyltranspeptidase n=1 Tax=Pseudobythopirellula maris TaxID=2527991 RepID=A0A5C5ZTW8_9BACT|nr:gamma-glutamyltransferase family protein [Pseudobythopirellula maris]TWT90311.1 Gamma-glutamyltranspeptidase precursor [Pseudobythopirellula maris]
MLRRTLSPPAIAAALVCIVSGWFAGDAWAQQRIAAERGVVVTGHPDATAAGLAVLRAGGNAMDAAVAASLALGVAEPYGSGLGGKMVLLHREATGGEIGCVEALCPSPAATDVKAFAALSSAKRSRGYHSACVPGLPAGLYAAHQKWGSKPWGELFDDAIRLAEEGVTVSEEMRDLMAPHEKRLAANPETAPIYLVDGRLPRVGERFSNPDLAGTLRRYRDGGAKGFYTGETAERIVAAAQAAGARLSLDDFRSFQPRFSEPLAINLRGYRVYSSPPPLTGGATVLAVLKGLEQADWPTAAPRDAAYIDRIGRLLQVFYPRISKSAADTPDAARLTRELLADDSIAAAVELAANLDPQDPKASLVGAHAATGATLDDRDDASTTHLVVIDSSGEMVSLTQSLSLHFGACVAPPGTGVLLNDSMSNFAIRTKSSPNYLAPGKRPRSTVAPVLVTRDGLPVLALGIPGGQRIPTTTIQLLADVLLTDTPLEQSFGRPRFHLRRPSTSKQPPNVIDLEEGASADELATLREELETLGWRTERKPHNGHYFGGGNAARFLAGGRLEGVADDRRTNFADGD